MNIKPARQLPKLVAELLGAWIVIGQFLNPVLAHHAEELGFSFG